MTSAGGTSGTGGANGGSPSGNGGTAGGRPDPCAPLGCTDHIWSVNGDRDTQSVRVGGVGVENGFNIEVEETLGDEGIQPTRSNLGVRITLTSPPGADYDLVYGCDATCERVSELNEPVHDLLGHSESIFYGATDYGGVAPYGDGWDQSFTIHIGIMAHEPAQDACLPWTLTVTTGPTVGRIEPPPGYPRSPPSPYPTPPGPMQRLDGVCH
jgi:hypothetical protein